MSHSDSVCSFFFSCKNKKIKKLKKTSRSTERKPRNGGVGTMCSHPSPSFLPKKDVLKNVGVFFFVCFFLRVCPVVCIIFANNQTPTLDQAHAALSLSLSLSLLDLCKQTGGSQKRQADQHTDALDYRPTNTLYSLNSLKYGLRTDELSPPPTCWSC